MNTSNVTNMESMFMNAVKFNNGSVDASGNSSSDPQHPLILDFTNCGTMYRMFYQCQILIVLFICGKIQAM